MRMDFEVLINRDAAQNLQQ